MSQSVSSRHSRSSRSSRASRRSVLSEQVQKLLAEPVPADSLLSLNNRGGGSKKDDAIEINSQSSDGSERSEVSDAPTSTPTGTPVKKARMVQPTLTDVVNLGKLGDIYYPENVETPQYNEGESFVGIDNYAAVEKRCGVACGRDNDFICVKVNCKAKTHQGKPKHEDFKPQHVFNKAKTSNRFKHVHAQPIVGPEKYALFEKHFSTVGDIRCFNPSWWVPRIDQLNPGMSRLQVAALFADPQKNPDRSDSPVLRTPSGSSQEKRKSTPPLPIPSQGKSNVPKVVGVAKKSNKNKRYPTYGDTLKMAKDRPIALREANELAHINADDADEQEEFSFELFRRAAELCGLQLPPNYHLIQYSTLGYGCARKLVESGDITWEMARDLEVAVEKLKLQHDAAGKRVSSLEDQWSKANSAIDRIKLIEDLVNHPSKSLRKAPKVWTAILDLQEAQKGVDRAIQDIRLKAQGDRLKAKEDRAQADKADEQLAGSLKQLLEQHKGRQEFEREVNRKIDARLQEKPTSSSSNSTENSNTTKELKELRAALVNFQNTNATLTRKIEVLEGRLTQQSANNQNNQGVSNQVLEDMRQSINNLGRKVDASNRRVNALEVSNDTTTQVYIIGTQTVRSASDVEQILLLIQEHIDYGLMIGPIELTNLIFELGAGKPPNSLDSIKLRKLAQEIGLSDYESKMLASFEQIFPIALCSSKTETATSFGEIPSTEWRDKTQLRKGIAYDMEVRAEKIKNSLEVAIDNHYDSGSADALVWANITKSIVRDTVTFLTTLIRYVDSMLEFLTAAGGYFEDESWSIVMKAVRRIFEEHFASVRGVPFGILPDSNSDAAAKKRFRARMIWNSLCTHQLVKEMNVARIRRHPLVEGAYSEWSLTHSGKLEASNALESVERLQDTVKTLEKTVSEAQAMAKNAKSAADRASTRQANGGGKDKK